jgi:transcription elongation factor Elf1
MPEKDKRCPFCGSNKITVFGYGTLKNVVRVECDLCGTCGPICRNCDITTEEPYQKWNTRHENKTEISTEI